jgi:hypothetical protein
VRPQAAAFGGIVSLICWKKGKNRLDQLGGEHGFLEDWAGGLPENPKIAGGEDIRHPKDKQAIGGRVRGRAAAEVYIEHGGIDAMGLVLNQLQRFVQAANRPEDLGAGVLEVSCHIHCDHELILDDKDGLASQGSLKFRHGCFLGTRVR